MNGTTTSWSISSYSGRVIGVESEDDYRAWRAEADADENRRVDSLSAFVENEHVSGVYKVIDTVDE